MPSGGMSSETTNCSNFAKVATRTSGYASSGDMVSVEIASEIVLTLEMPCTISGIFVYLGSNSALISIS